MEEVIVSSTCGGIGDGIYFPLNGGPEEPIGTLNVPTINVGLTRTKEIVVCTRISEATCETNRPEVGMAPDDQMVL